MLLLLRRINQGSGSSQAPPAPDSTPDAFSLLDVTDATLSTLYVSNAISVLNINVPATITVVGGEYRINGTGSWFITAGTVGAGDTVEVRATSSASNSDDVDVLLDIGGVSDTYTITTVAASNVPNAPSLDWTSGSADTTPDFDVTLPTGFGDFRDAAVGDVLRIEYAHGSTYLTRTLILGDISGSALNLSASALSDGTYAFRARLERTGGTLLSAWSADETVIVSTGTADAHLLLRDGASNLLKRDGLSKIILAHIGASAGLILLRDGTSKLLARNNTDRIPLGH